jgi:hypothetical protein
VPILISFEVENYSGPDDDLILREASKLNRFTRESKLLQSEVDFRIIEIGSFD